MLSKTTRDCWTGTWVGCPCAKGKAAPSDRVFGTEDRIVDPHVIAQVGDVVAFALAVGVVLHAVERQVGACGARGWGPHY